MKRSLAILALLLAAAPAMAMAQSSLDEANRSVAIQHYARTGQARVVRSGTIEMFPFGHVQPQLTCAPIRVCSVELEGGEKIIDDFLADPVRWTLDIGEGPNQAPMLYVSPRSEVQPCDLTTNLVITTDRRVYHFTLDSPPCPKDLESTNPHLPYTRHVKFYYPDDRLRHHGPPEGPQVFSNARLTSNRPRSAGAEPAAATAPGMRLGAEDLSAMYFGYKVEVDREFPWEPEQVYDNGQSTCIRIPAKASRYAHPVLYEADRTGELMIVNYVQRDGCYESDRVMDKMILVLGDAKGRPVRLVITRKAERKG